MAAYEVARRGSAPMLWVRPTASQCRWQLSRWRCHFGAASLRYTERPRADVRSPHGPRGQNLAVAPLHPRRMRSAAQAMDEDHVARARRRLASGYGRQTYRSWNLRSSETIAGRPPGSGRDCHAPMSRDQADPKALTPVSAAIQAVAGAHDAGIAARDSRASRYAASPCSRTGSGAIQPWRLRT